MFAAVHKRNGHDVALARPSKHPQAAGHMQGAQQAHFGHAALQWVSCTLTASTVVVGRT